MASFIAIASGLSCVVARRVPMATPSAPRLKAAFRPRPLANPPAATMGTVGNSCASEGTNTREVTSPPWAAASWPVTIKASAPAAIAAAACFRLVTVARSLPPYSSRPSRIQSALPSETLMTGTPSSRATLAFSEAPGMSNVAPTPKGLSVRVRISRIHALVSNADSGPVANIPRPPALETAATRAGVEIHDIPGSTMGCSHPKTLVIRVEMVRMVVLAALVEVDAFCRDIIVVMVNAL
mmetsp:Transcript_8884/g.21934  ORF Transcript_8884/g.21934 Transcript_8884/m.21934 type:complete len:239 (-) Transcript_8884:25-741(-)